MRRDPGHMKVKAFFGALGKSRRVAPDLKRAGLGSEPRMAIVSGLLQSR